MQILYIVWAHMTDRWGRVAGRVAQETIAERDASWGGFNNNGRR